MKRNLLTISFFTLLFAITTNEAKSQVETSNVAVTIATVTELVANNTVLTPFAFSTGEQLEAGITQANAVNLAYKSNKLTKITIKALGSGFFNSCS